MKKDLLICVITFIFLIMYLFIIIKKNKIVYIENHNQHICQKCIIQNENYYCRVYGLNEGSDK